MQDRHDSAKLEAQLSGAIERYRATWQPVDSELYSLCRRRPGQRTFADVFAKVAIIGRVYEAGIARSSQASGDREAAVARGLAGQADLIEAGLGKLAARRFDRESAAEIVELHGRVCRALLPHTGGTWQQSFVSKYLHFHCDIIPIYDSRAQEAIGHHVDWDTVTPVRESLGFLPEWARYYRNFTAAFIVLHERIAAETPLQATVKEVDHLLWETI
jgi:hypothetical protein